ncbi:MAG: hypothetical protein MZU97_01510 [Bacillus subtilis]|nr:hypothetical protein [Bacillus subtilis]
MKTTPPALTGLSGEDVERRMKEGKHNAVKNYASEKRSTDRVRERLHVLQLHSRDACGPVVVNRLVSRTRRFVPIALANTLIGIFQELKARVDDPESSR